MSDLDRISVKTLNQAPALIVAIRDVRYILTDRKDKSAKDAEKKLYYEKPCERDHKGIFYALRKEWELLQIRSQ